MASLSTILNLVQCGLGAILGTGTKGCKPFFKKVTAMWLTPQGFKYDGSQTMNEAYIQTLQAEGNLIVLKGIRTFTDNTEDDVIETLEDGTKQVARLGLYEFAMQFINGLYFHAALHSISSFGAYDVTMIDRDGNILGTKASDGSLKGFTVGMLQASKFTFATDAVGQKEGFMLQLLERAEFDTNYVFIDNASLDFNPNTVDGINEVVLTYGTAPANLATNLQVVAVTKQDNAPFTGATYTDFLLTVDGVTGNPSAGDDSVLGGTYELTVSALATNEVLALDLYDNSGNNEVITLGGYLYKSLTLDATVV